MRRALPLGFAATIFAVVAMAGPAPADPLKIRIGGVAPAADLVELMFAKPGVARHLGQSYDYAPVHFVGTPQILTAIATGDLDIGVFSYSSVGLAIENAKMDDLRIVADVFQDGVAGYYTGEFMVLNDSPIHTVDDLKGKVIATPGAGSALDVAARAMMRNHHMEEKKDYTMVEIALPNMMSVLTDKKVDLIGAGLVNMQPELRTVAHDLFTQRDAIGTTQMLVLGSRAGFLAKNRAAVVDFLEDELRARHFYFDPANHADAVGIVSSFTKIPAAKLDFLFTRADFYRDPNGRPDLGSLQSNEDLLRQLGFLKTAIDVTGHADLSLVDEAAKRLK
jgi:NitT/TauT family transport system substrate-binding protein